MLFFVVLIIIYTESMDGPSDGPTDGHDLLKRCVVASKNSRISIIGSLQVKDMSSTSTLNYNVDLFLDKIISAQSLDLSAKSPM